MELQFETIAWDESMENGRHPVGNFLVAPYGVMTNAGFKPSGTYAAFVNGIAMGMGFVDREAGVLACDAMVHDTLTASIKKIEPIVEHTTEPARSADEIIDPL